MSTNLGINSYKKHFRVKINLVSTFKFSTFSLSNLKPLSHEKINNYCFISIDVII